MFTRTFLPRVAGAELVVHYLATECAAAGHHVTVLAPGRDRLKLTLPYAILPIYGLGDASRRAPDWLRERLYLVQLLAIHRRERFDVLHCHTFYPSGYVGALFKRAARVPLVMTSHGGDFTAVAEANYGLGLRPHLRPKLEAALRAADAVTAISEFIAQETLAVGVDRARVFRIENGVDAEGFERHKHAAPPKEMQALDRQDFVVLTVARNHPKKRLADVLEALALLSGGPQRAVGVIVGGGVSQLAPLARSLGVAPRVFLLEQIPSRSQLDHSNGLNFPPPELVAAYFASSAFLLPSLAEAYPLVILEAMAAGLPVVTTDVTGNHDVVQHGRNGLLVPTHSPQAIADSLTRLMRDSGLRAGLIAGGRATASRHTWKAVASAYMDVYQRVQH